MDEIKSRKAIKTIFLELFFAMDKKFNFNIWWFLSNLLFLGKINISKGNIVKEQTKEIVNPINIIKPKSIIGLISVIISDPKATIVVSVV